MRNGMFFRLAVNNVKRNKGTYIPYMLTCVFCIAMMYMMFFITQNPQLSQTVPSFAEVRTIMFLGIFVVGIFSLIFLLYSNSFLMKRRQKELGLYNILGLEKGHIKKMMLLETCMTSVVSMAAGILAGILGSKLAMLLLLKLLHVPAQLGFYVCGSGIIACIVFFCAVFFITLLKNVRRVSVSQPAELLRGSNVGEREPKAKWLLALIGFICLGSGYYIAVTTESPLEAIGLFFLAVLLVMAGTYLLFTTGSIAILKMMRWKKSFYYKTRNFTTVSGMIYRMKQNAMGLASICILSTGVLLMVSAAASLNVGMEDIMEERYPYDANYDFYGFTLEEGQKAGDYFREILEQEQIPYGETMSLVYLPSTYLKEDGEIKIVPTYSVDYSDLGYLKMITEEEYERITGVDPGLSPGEVWAYASDQEGDSLIINGETYPVKKWLEKEEIMARDESSLDLSETILVLAREDFEKLDQIQQEAYERASSEIQLTLGVDIEGEKEDKIYYGNLISERLKAYLSEENLSEDITFRPGIREENYDSYYASNGGLLFLGLFLGGLFMVGTGMIIYYKQVSEGYEDKERFEIMQKVGMSRKEVKESIRRQILMVFFIPLLTAVLHMTMAFPMVNRLLRLFGMMNTKLYMLCTAGTIAVFVVIYAIIYLCTARTYYRIVERKA